MINDPAVIIPAVADAECGELTFGQVHDDTYCISQELPDDDYALLALTSRQLRQLHAAIGHELAKVDAAESPNGGRRPGAGRPKTPHADAMVADVLAGIKPASVAAAYGVSVNSVYCACKARGVSTRWRSHKMLLNTQEGSAAQ